MPRLGDPSPPLLRTGNAKSVLLTLKTRADEALIITKCSPASRLRRTLPQLHTGSSPSNAGSAAYLEPLLAAKRDFRVSPLGEINERSASFPGSRHDLAPDDRWPMGA